MSKNLNELIVLAQNNELTLEDMNFIVATVVTEIEKHGSDIKSLREQQAKDGREIVNLRDETSITPAEADDISREVRKVGVMCMGGKKSNAYANGDLRRQIYRDIYGEIKRNYGLVDEMGRQQSYKKLRRKHFKGALQIVHQYTLPIALQNEVDAENELDLDD